MVLTGSRLGSRLHVSLYRKLVTLESLLDMLLKLLLSGSYPDVLLLKLAYLVPHFSNLTLKLVQLRIHYLLLPFQANLGLKLLIVPQEKFLVLH